MLQSVAARLQIFERIRDNNASLALAGGHSVLKHIEYLQSLIQPTTFACATLLNMQATGLRVRKTVIIRTSRVHHVLATLAHEKFIFFLLTP